MQPWWVQLPLELEDNARDEMARGGGAACARPDSWSEGSLRGNLVRRGQRRATAAAILTTNVGAGGAARGAPRPSVAHEAWLVTGEGLGPPGSMRALEPLAAYLPMQTRAGEGLGRSNNTRRKFDPLANESMVYTIPLPMSGEAMIRSGLPPAMCYLV